jgi:hypothetical protein
MAHTQPGPATPGTTSVFSSDREELMHGVHTDAQGICLALASLMELLRGCDPAYQLSAGGLESILEPIWGCMETLCGDLNTAKGGVDPC